MPSDTNFGGSIFGGWIMAQTDIAASIVAVKRAKGRVATVAVNHFEFKKPVLVGDVVSFYADVVSVGNTSITVHVDVYSQRNPQNEECYKVTEATLTFVALDEERRPRPVPPEEGHGR